jgi:hypothetical protein
VFDLAKNPWYYVAHYRHSTIIGYTVGHVEVCAPRRITDRDGFREMMDRVREVAATNSPPPIDDVILTGLTLLGGPDDRADSAEDVKARALAARVREVAEAWAALTESERSFIGGQLGHDALANALYNLTDMVAR